MLAKYPDLDGEKKRVYLRRAISAGLESEVLELGKKKGDHYSKRRHHFFFLLSVQKGEGLLTIVAQAFLQVTRAAARSRLSIVQLVTGSSRERIMIRWLLEVK